MMVIWWMSALWFVLGAVVSAPPRPNIQLISPRDGMLVHEQRPVFVWADVGAPAYQVNLAGATATYSLSVTPSCSQGMCAWQSTVYLDPGEWRWSVRGGTDVSAEWHVYVGAQSVLDGGVIIERRLDYGAFVVAAGLVVLAVLVGLRLMFDVVVRRSTW